MKKNSRPKGPAVLKTLRDSELLCCSVFTTPPIFITLCREKLQTAQERVLFQKILVSVKFLSAILGTEMAAPILWTPGKMRSFCRKSHFQKIPRFRGGGVFRGRGSADFIFMGARIFLIFPPPLFVTQM